MYLDDKALNKLEGLIKELFENKLDYEIKDYLIDKTINRSVELKKLLKEIFRKIRKEEICDLEFIDLLNISSVTKNVLRRYLYKFENLSFVDRDDILCEYGSQKFYLDDIKNLEPFTEKEEKELFTEYQATLSKDVYNKILEKSLRYVPYYVSRYISKKNISSELDFMDLVQEGNLGLMYALEKFDLNKNIRFISYAKHWIRNYINKAIMEKGKQVRLPQLGNYALNVIDENAKLEDKISVYNNNIKRQTIENYMKFKDPLVSLQDTTYNDLDEEVELINTIMDDQVPLEEKIEEKIEKEEIRKLVKEMILEIDDERLKEIILLRYGFINDKIYTHSEIGQKKGLTKQRIYQLEKKAINEIKQTKTIEKIKKYVRGK